MTSWRVAGSNRKIHGNALTAFEVAVLEDQAGQAIEYASERAREYRATRAILTARALAGVFAVLSSLSEGGQDHAG